EGEVNTWPGQAASSIPTPTNPVCRGSWPDPPPEISATLAGFGLLRMTKSGSMCTATSWAWAAPNPSMPSYTRSLGRLVNFFIAARVWVLGRLWSPRGRLSCQVLRSDDLYAGVAHSQCAAHFFAQ